MGKGVPSWEVSSLSASPRQRVLILVLPNFSLLGCQGVPHTKEGLSQGHQPGLLEPIPRSQGGCQEDLGGESQLRQR